MWPGEHVVRINSSPSSSIETFFSTTRVSSRPETYLARNRQDPRDLQEFTLKLREEPTYPAERAQNCGTSVPNLLFLPAKSLVQWDLSSAYSMVKAVLVLT